MPYSSSGGSWWEWIGEGSRQKRLITIDQLPTTPGEYQAPVRQDILPPSKVHRLSGHGLSWDQVSDLIDACDTRGATVTITDKNQKVHSGYLVSFTYTDIGGLELYDAEIQLEV